MKKFVLCALLVAMLVALASPVMAWDAAKDGDLKKDKNNMQWYLVSFGKDATTGVPYAITRKYYTNTTIKNETIELLMSKYGISPEVAGSLYFTEYCYEYTEDGKQFAVTYQRHYDMLGNEIHGTVFDGATEATKKNFIALSSVAGSAPAKAAVQLFGKSAASSTTSKASTTKSTVPAKRVVRAKKK